MIYIIVLILFFSIAGVVLKEKKYHNTTYYKSTKTPLFFMDKGKSVEYELFSKLQKLEEKGAKFLFNIYLPMSYNRTTEVDMVMISAKGIFVFESKNYSGWIFGNERQSKWTVTYKGGRKERLVNPIKQNNWHIQCLKKQIDIISPVYSVIAFSNYCTLKNVAIYDKNIVFGYANNVVSVIYDIHKNVENNILSYSNIQNIHDTLYPMAKVDKYVKQKHIEDIQKIHKCN